MGSLTRTDERSVVPIHSAEGRFQSLAAKLVPATRDEAMSVIKFMFKVLPLAATDEDDDEAIDILIAAYQIACRGQPRWALVQARDAFIKGEVAGHSTPFCPNPAVFGREVSRIVDKDRLAASRARQEAEQAARWGDASEPKEPTSPEARAMVERFLQQSKAVAAQQREDMVRRPDPKPAVPGYAARVAAETAGRKQARGSEQ